MPIIGAKGSPSSQGFGQFAQANAVANYIEDVFSTYLYTGNGSTQTVTNGIDLAGKGGLVWINSSGNFLFDTERSVLNVINSNTTTAQTSPANSLTSFNNNGFSLGSAANINTNASAYTAWTFRQQAKFFDVVTWTGNGANRTIAHNLGSVPGCIMVKRTDTVADWQVYHRSLANTEYMVLNNTAGKATGATRWNSTTPTDTVFSLGTDTTVNASGGTYVAYIYAHDAGGFGLTGTDNVISCGTFTTTSSATVNLGYEPQWLLYRTVLGGGSWNLLDYMRGWNLSSDYVVSANTTTGFNLNRGNPTATGFNFSENNSTAYIYIAIRRGPMKVPTDGTSVFGLNARNGTGANATVTGGAGVTDLAIIKNRISGSPAYVWASRLASVLILDSASSNQENLASTSQLQANPWNVMDGIKVGTTSTTTNDVSSTFINYLFKRAPSFFDMAFYSGTGAASTVAHNLKATPELIIARSRSTSGSGWYVYSSALGATNYVQLNSTSASSTDVGAWNNTSPTSSVFTAGTYQSTSSTDYISCLFATCPGVSKVGSYTGNGTTQAIACGFTGGARFVLIKRTDSTGGWYVYDTARGMTTLTDPYLFFNVTNAESATLGSVTTTAGGFTVNAAVLAAINTNAASYIFLAIA